MTKSLLPDHRRSSSHLLARILAAPDLPAQVQALPAATLAKLVRRVGLEDAGEIIALATTEQLAQVFDEDLWRNARPGEEERFDAGRFLLWLSVMLEAGEGFVGAKLRELPADLVTLAFHRQILVLRTDVTLAEMQQPDDEAAAADKLLEGALTEEFGEYLLVSRQHDGWDDVFSAFLALDREDHEFAVDLLERCCQMGADQIDDEGGLYQLLSSSEMLEGDVGGGREDRRAESGYVDPSSAAAFLKHARDSAAGTTRDWLTESYFRRHAGAPVAAAAEEPEAGRSDVLLLLQEAGVVDAPASPLLLTSDSSETRAKEPPPMVRVLQRLGEEDSDRFVTRSQEVGYLANALLAGCTFRGRRLRPIEAVHAAIATCSLGLELLAREAATSDPIEDQEALLGQPADALFRGGWHALNRQVIQPAAESAQHWLRRAAENADDVDAAEFRRAADRVKAAAAAGTPWKARAILDALLAVLETDDVEALRGLIDECPTLSGGEHRFISSIAEMDQAAEFLTTDEHG